MRDISAKMPGYPGVSGQPRAEHRRFRLGATVVLGLILCEGSGAAYAATPPLQAASMPALGIPRAQDAAQTNAASDLGDAHPSAPLGKGGVPKAALLPPAGLDAFDDRGFSAYVNARRKDATRMEITFQVLNVLDAAQTVSCLSRQTCAEGNPLYGSHPPAGQVIGIKAGMGVLHWLVFKTLIDRDSNAARWFGRLTVAVQGGVVASNLRFTF